MARKIKDTAFGKWLKRKAPEVAETVADLLPDRGGLGVAKRLLDKLGDGETSEEAERRINEMLAQEAERTKRWEADAQSGGLAAKVRPIIVLGSCGIFVLFALLDAINWLIIKEAYINLLESLLLTSVGGYFVLRSADKYTTGRK